MAARARVELVHSLASTAPLWGRFRRVATVHDLIYPRFPDAHRAFATVACACSSPSRPAARIG